MPKYVTGDVPLHVAAKEDNMESVKRLLRCGADMDIKNNAGITPMDLLARVERELRDDIAEGAEAREVS